MIQIGFIIAIGLAFSRLARKYKKSSLLFGIVGGGLAVLFTAVSAIVVSRIGSLTITTHSTITSSLKLLFLSMALSGFFCWLMYMLFEFLWKKELTSHTSSELIDEELTDDEFS